MVIQISMVCKLLLTHRVNIKYRDSQRPGKENRDVPLQERKKRDCILKSSLGSWSYLQSLKETIWCSPQFDTDCSYYYTIFISRSGRAHLDFFLAVYVFQGFVSFYISLYDPNFTPSPGPAREKYNNYFVGAFPQYQDYASFGKSTGWVCLALGYMQLGNSVSSTTVPVMCSSATVPVSALDIIFSPVRLTKISTEC